jgi:hypothetical protein
MEGREDPEALAAYLKKVEDEAVARKQARRKGKKPGTPKKKQAKLIEFELPDTLVAGQAMTVKIPHRLPEDLGEQPVHVTLKAGSEEKRVSREVVKATGKGVLEIPFEIPAEIPDGVVSFSAFVGDEYAKNLQHISSDKVSVE